MAIMNLTNGNNPIIEGMSDKLKELIGQEILNKIGTSSKLKDKEALQTAMLELRNKKRIIGSNL